MTKDKDDSGQDLEAAPGFTLDRVRAALTGRFNPDDLTEDEWTIYDDMAFNSLAEPTDAERAAYAAVGAQPGAVGMDENDNIVRVRPDGSLEVIKP